MKNWTPKQIKKFRKDLDMTQTKFGDMVGVAKITVFQWERGERKPSETARILLSRIEETIEKKETVEIFKVDLQKEILEKFSEKERMFFIQSSHFLNEINILYKALLVVIVPRKYNAVERAANYAQRLLFIRLVASKLSEGWSIIKDTYFGSALSRSLSRKINTESKSALKVLKNYFKKKNNLNIIRNKFGFHYDSEFVKKGFNKLRKADEQDLIMYLSEDRGNSLYSFSDLIIHTAMAETVISTEENQPLAGESNLKPLLNEINLIYNCFQEFLIHCYVALIEDKDLSRELINIPKPHKFNRINFPFLMSK